MRNTVRILFCVRMSDNTHSNYTDKVIYHKFTNNIVIAKKKKKEAFLTHRDESWGNKKIKIIVRVSRRSTTIM